jgi:hypothetical protein
MKLDCLSFLDDFSNRDGTRGAIGAEQIPNEKITTLKPILMFIDNNTKMKGTLAVLIR